MTESGAAQAPVPPKPPQGLTRQDVLSVLGALGAILTLVTGVLFYFGWRRSDVQAVEMGVDVSLFGFSSQDYVLRSISSLYLPLIVIFGVVLGWLWLHSRVTTLLRSDQRTANDRHATAAEWARWFSVGLGVLAATCVLFTLAAGVRPPLPVVGRLARGVQNHQWVVPLALLISTVTAAYLWWIYRQLTPSRHVEPLPLWRTLLPALLIAGTVFLGAFWMLEEYASAVGRGYARQLSDDVDRLPRAVVVSPTPLGIDAPGVREERLGVTGSPDVRYRTTGLRLLARSGGKVLLVHDGWSPRTGTVIVLSDSDELAWEFSR
jgi:hypothetical protein